MLRAYLQEAGFVWQGVESFSGRLSVTLLSIEFALKARGCSRRKMATVAQSRLQFTFAAANLAFLSGIGNDK